MDKVFPGDDKQLGHLRKITAGDCGCERSVGEEEPILRRLIFTTVHLFSVIFISLFIYLAVQGLSCGTWDIFLVVACGI